MKASYRYAEDGYDVAGRKLPDVPVLWLELAVNGRRLRGPCLVDTGFDGSLYANEDLALLLEGCEPIGRATLYAVGERSIECELFETKARLVTEASQEVLGLGELLIYVPTSPDDLSHEVIVGREVLNKLTLKLDGRMVEVL